MQLTLESPNHRLWVLMFTKSLNEDGQFWRIYRCWEMLMLCLTRQFPIDESDSWEEWAWGSLIEGLKHTCHPLRWLPWIPWPRICLWARSLGEDQWPVSTQWLIYAWREWDYWEKRDGKHHDLEDRFACRELFGDCCFVICWLSLKIPLIPHWWSALIWSWLMGRWISLMSWSASAESLGFDFFVIILLTWLGCRSDCWACCCGWAGPFCWAWWRCSGRSPGGIWNPGGMRNDSWLRNSCLRCWGWRWWWRWQWWWFVDSLPQQVKPWEVSQRAQQWLRTSDP